MSLEFSANISMLRKEKHISQKKAADDLGISQALLSHYENGIRECSLDFVKKAAIYYNVSTDYLLSMPANTDNYLDDCFDYQAPNDELPLPITIARCITLLMADENFNDETAKLYRDYFSLLTAKYVKLISNNSFDADFYDYAVKKTESAIIENAKINNGLSRSFLSLNTLVNYTDSLLGLRSKKIREEIG